MNRMNINKDVAITAVYFRGRQFKMFPKSMEYNGDTYTFAESGLQYQVKKGESAVQLFDMTDGAATYRLKHDQQNNWTLVTITQHA